MSELYNLLTVLCKSRLYLWSNFVSVLVKVDKRIPRQGGRSAAGPRFYQMTICLLLLLCSISNVTGQAHALMPESDSIQIYEWGRQAHDTFQSDPESAMLLVYRALNLSEKYQHDQSQVKLLRLKGIMHQKNGQYDAAIYSFDQALIRAKESNFMPDVVATSLAMLYNEVKEVDLAKEHLRLAYTFANELADTTGMIRSLNNLGSFCIRMDLNDEAELYYIQSLKLQQASKNSSADISTLQNLGYLSFQNNDISKGLDYYNQGVDLAKARQDYRSLGLLHLYIAQGYHGKGLLEQSLESYHNALEFETYLKQADLHKLNILRFTLDYLFEEEEEVLTITEKGIRLAKENADMRRLSELYVFRGGAFANLNQIDSAIICYQRCLSICLEHKINRLIKTPLRSLGDCYQQQNQLDSALFYLEQAEIHSKLEYSPYAYSLLNISFGHLYKKKQENGRALQYFKDALSIANAYGYKKGASEANYQLYAMLEQQGEVTQAFSYLKNYQILQDSIFGEKQGQNLIALKTEYEFEKEKALLLQKSKTDQTLSHLQIQKQQLWIGFFLFALLTSLIGAYYLIKNQKSKRKSEVEKERLRADLKSQQLKLETQEREKLQVMDDFKSNLFTNISHELRTPLSIIKGMNRKVKDNPEEWIDIGTNMIEQNTDQMLKLVNKILLLQSLESNQVALQLVQGNILNQLKNIFYSLEHHGDNKGVKMTMECDDSPIIMDYDPEKMRWIVSNLLSNAIKFTPENGDVRMKVVKQEKRLNIEISDTGIGIKLEDQSKVFDRYFQTKNDFNPTGSGVGLALVKELVHLIKGEIRVESEVNKGTVFSLTIPIANNATSEPILQSVPQQTKSDRITTAINGEHTLVPDANRLDILIVEDNQDMHKLLRANLQMEYNVLSANDGQQGIDLAIEKTPDIIISDVMMPIKNGYELCQALKQDERTSHIPIILLTAKADHESKLNGLERGADTYLSKPFDEKELKLRIKNLLTLRARLQQRYLGMTAEEGVRAEDHDLEDEFLQKVKDYIHLDISNEAIGMKDLCEHLGMSRSQVFRKIKALTGKSPSKLIRSIRLRQARKLIQTTDMNMAQVAYSTGFSSSSYFSTCYREEFNERPSDVKIQS